MITVPWSKLRGIGNSTAAKATILIPLVGYFFLFNSHFISWLHLHEVVEPVALPNIVEAELGWRLLCLYYGLMSVAIATIMYAAFCPQVCKRYADSVEYSREVQLIYSSLAAFDGLVGELKQQMVTGFAPSNIRNAADGELKLLGTGSAVRIWESLPAAERPSRLLRLLAAKYNLIDYTRPVARRATAVLYVLGLLILAVPSTHLFYRVTLATVAVLWASVRG